MDMNWSCKNKSRVFDTRESAGVPYFPFKALDNIGLTVNGPSTHIGRASRGKSSAMNSSCSRGDATEDVLESFMHMVAALGVERDHTVVSHQAHAVNLCRVTLEDTGKGVVKERGYRSIDGLIIGVPGLALVAFYADCAPLYLLDPVNRAIRLSYSRWRETVKRMCQVTVGVMKEASGTKPEDPIACVDPSICRGYFEVGGEVVERLRGAFGPEHREVLHCQGKKPGKYRLDLREADEITLRGAGIRWENIHITNTYTICNSDYLFSHRKVGGGREDLAAFLYLK